MSTIACPACGDVFDAPTFDCEAICECGAVVEWDFDSVDDDYFYVENVRLAEEEEP